MKNVSLLFFSSFRGVPVIFSSLKGYRFAESLLIRFSPLFFHLFEGYRFAESLLIRFSSADYVSDVVGSVGT